MNKSEICSILGARYSGKLQLFFVGNRKFKKETAEKRAKAIKKEEVLTRALDTNKARHKVQEMRMMWRWGMATWRKTGAGDRTAEKYKKYLEYSANTSADIARQLKSVGL